MADEPKPTTLAVERDQPALGDSCELFVLDGPDAGRTFALESTVRVGSGADCEVALTDRAVSATHITVEVTDTGFHVVDRGSTNGTYYLETRVTDAVVPPGATLELGGTRICLRRTPRTPEPEEPRDSYGELVGSSPVMQKLYAMLDRAAAVDHSVLIRGETGVGKELVARSLHRESTRSAQPFEVFDCGAVPANLVESELFGHVKGSFTGATRDHKGVFERANRGTVFLDEIGELPLDLQPKLLRALENREIRPVGADATVALDLRVLAATNRDLEEDVHQGLFRSDLYYRLNVIELVVPPLRDRRADIAPLVRHFAGDGVELSDETLELFVSGYDWPGNVRELKNAVARALSLGEVTLQPSAPATPSMSVDTAESLPEAKRKLVEAFERDYLATQLRQSDGNMAEAARRSGVDRSYFRRLLLRYGLID